MMSQLPDLGKEAFVLNGYSSSEKAREHVEGGVARSATGVESVKSDRLPQSSTQEFSHEEAESVKALLSGHAAMRLRQRGLSLQDVAYIMGNGSSEQVAAATIYFLREVDIPGDERALYQRLVGTAVITAPDDDGIITVWRNRKNGLRNLRQKRQLRRRYSTPPIHFLQMA
jgi:hypothetical protein